MNVWSRPHLTEARHGALELGNNLRLRYPPYSWGCWCTNECVSNFRRANGGYMTPLVSNGSSISSDVTCWIWPCLSPVLLKCKVALKKVQVIISSVSDSETVKQQWNTSLSADDGRGSSTFAFSRGTVVFLRTHVTVASNIVSSQASDCHFNKRRFRR